MCCDTAVEMPGDGRVTRRLETLLKLRALETTTRVATIASAFDAWPQDGSDEHYESAGVDVASFTAEGWHRMDDRDFETLWLELQPSQVPVLIPQTECTTRLAAL
jgi:hypothetical protein